MGFFVTLNGNFPCIRCGSEHERSIQTKLLRTEADNSCHPYRQGDSEIIDGLDDYLPLFSWNRTEPLVVLVGDWSCSECKQNWQWARVVLEYTDRSRELATIVKIEGLRLNRVEELAGIHYVEDELLYLTELVAEWDGLSVQSRCDAIVSNYRDWCVNIAGFKPIVWSSDFDS